MTAEPDRAVSDPVGLVTTPISAVEWQLAPGRTRAVVTAVAGGRAKARRLAAVLAEQPGNGVGEDRSGSGAASGSRRCWFSV